MGAFPGLSPDTSQYPKSWGSTKAQLIILVEDDHSCARFVGVNSFTGSNYTTSFSPKPLTSINTLD
jgi:hypothetical protein